MKVLSISMRRPGCGVADYAGLIEAELRRLGYDVQAVSHCEAARVVLSGHFDRVLMHFEIVETSRGADVLWMLKTLARLNRQGIQPTVISHTFLSDGVLVKALKPVRLGLKVYQRLLLRSLGSRSDLVVLNRAAVDALKELGVQARYVPFGVYRRAQNGSSRLSGYRAEGRLVCGVVGHPYRFKRYDLAALAFLGLKTAFRSSSIFAVVGGDATVDPESWEQLRRTFDAFEPGEIVVTGMLSDDEFAASVCDIDVALLPYEDLPTGSSVAAGLCAAHVPMIVSPSPAFRGVVEAGGALVAYKWPPDASEALSRLIANPSIRLEMRRSLERLEQRESLSASARAMVEGFGRPDARPIIVLVRPERELCGISHWARQLEDALTQAGADVVGLTHTQFLKRALGMRADGLIWNLEIGSDTKKLDAFSAFFGMRLSRVPRSARLCVIHSVFAPDQLHLPRVLAQLAVAYQWRMFHSIAKYAKLATLSDESHRRVLDHGLESVGLRLGVYTDSLSERVPPDGVAAMDQRLRIGLIGHPYVSKHYDDAVRAFALLPERVRKKACIVVVGGYASFDPAGAAALNAELARLSAEEYIATGALSESAFSRWLDRLDLAIMPYRERASSSAVLSRVVGHGIPALVTPTNVFKPLIDSGCAAAVDNWPEDAAVVLEQLIGSPELLRDMRKRAARLAAEDSLGVVALQFLDAMGLRKGTTGGRGSG